MQFSAGSGRFYYGSRGGFITPPPSDDPLLLEDGDIVFLEDGSEILLEA